MPAHGSVIPRTTPDGQLAFNLEVTYDAYHCGYRLNVEVTKDDEWLYEVHIADLHTIESQLNGGRFDRFYPCELPIKFEMKVPHYHSSEARVAENGRLFRWIAENTKGRWNFRTYLPNINDCRYVWSFEELNDAMMFKLVCG